MLPNTKQIIDEIEGLKQQYEDAVATVIRDVYLEFYRAEPEVVSTALDHPLALSRLETEFVRWVVKNKPEYVVGIHKEFIVFDSIVVMRSDYFSDDYFLFTGKWCDKKYCSGDLFHQLPYFSERLEFSIFTAKHFPELIQYAAFNPMKYVDIDVRTRVYEAGSGCVVSAYGQYHYVEVAMDGSSVSELRDKIENHQTL